jgi:DNA transposase THAP9
MNRSLEENRKKHFTPELKCFALNLSYFSNSGYGFLRKTLGNLLPAPRTLHYWLQKIDASPGFTTASFQLLQNKITTAKKNGKKFVCALSMDEMAVRKQIKWDKHKNRFIGLVDFDSKGDNEIVANKALVFMLTAINDNWKIPIGYFNVSRLNHKNRADLIERCFEQLNELDLELASLTFDGDKANIRAVESLGANFSSVDVQSSVLNRFSGKPVYVFLDMCHAIKLVRNNFAKQAKLKVGSQTVKWKYIEELEKLQSAKGLHLGTKLREKHINFQPNKMNVKLAVQTLSESVACGLDYGREDLKMAEFKNSEATATFCRIFNKTFDIFNSRSQKCAFFKAPLSESNQQEFFSYLDTVFDYIKSLKTTKNKLVIESKSKTGFLGIIFNIQSLKNFYKRYIFIFLYIEFLLICIFLNKGTWKKRRYWIVYSHTNSARTIWNFFLELSGGEEGVTITPQQTNLQVHTNEFSFMETLQCLQQETVHHRMEQKL